MVWIGFGTQTLAKHQCSLSAHLDSSGAGTDPVEVSPDLVGVGVPPEIELDSDLKT